MVVTVSTLLYIIITISSILMLGRRMYYNHIYTLEGYISDKTLEKLKCNLKDSDDFQLVSYVDFELNKNNNDVAIDYEVK